MCRYVSNNFKISIVFVAIMFTAIAMSIAPLIEIPSSVRSKLLGILCSDMGWKIIVVRRTDLSIFNTDLRE